MAIAEWGSYCLVGANALAALHTPPPTMHCTASMHGALHIMHGTLTDNGTKHKYPLHVLSPGHPQSQSLTPQSITPTAPPHSLPNPPPRPQFADSIGLPTDEGLFGFRPFSEVWCGRLAMMGFVTSIVEEATTGQGTLRQIGLEPSSGLLTFMLAALGTAVVVGSASTAAKLVKKEMTKKDVARYRNFLGLNNANDYLQAANEMKVRPASIISTLMLSSSAVAAKAAAAA